MYFAGYPQFNQSMPQMSMPVNATNQQGSSVQGANTGMLGSMFGMGLGGFGGGFSPSGFSMPQMGYGGMGGYGGFGGMGGGFGGMGGYGGGFGMPQMGYGGFGGMGGYGGGFGMPQMGYGLGSFGSQVGFGGYGNYGGFQPPQQARSGSIQDNMNNPAYRQQMAFVNGNSEEAIRNRIQGQLNDDFTRNKNAGMSLMDNAKAQDELSNRLYSQYGIERPRLAADIVRPPSGMEMSQTTGWDPKFIGDLAPPPGWARQYTNPNPADIRITDGYFHGAQPNPSTGVMPSEPIPDPGDSGMVYTQALIPATVGGVEGYYTDGSRRNFVPYDKIPSDDAYIPDETGQYDPNRGNYGQILQPTYSEPSAPVAEPLSIAGPPQVTQENILGTLVPANSAPINQPRRMRNSMNMGIGSFFGGIGPGNFRNFYNP